MVQGVTQRKHICKSARVEPFWPYDYDYVVFRKDNIKVERWQVQKFPTCFHKDHGSFKVPVHDTEPGQSQQFYGKQYELLIVEWLNGHSYEWNVQLDPLWKAGVIVWEICAISFVHGLHESTTRWNLSGDWHCYPYRKSTVGWRTLVSIAHPFGPGPLHLSRYLWTRSINGVAPKWW